MFTQIFTHLLTFRDILSILALFLVSALLKTYKNINKIKIKTDFKLHFKFEILILTKFITQIKKH